MSTIIVVNIITLQAPRMSRVVGGRADQWPQEECLHHQARASPVYSTKDPKDHLWDVRGDTKGHGLKKEVRGAHEDEVEEQEEQADYVYPGQVRMLCCGLRLQYLYIF